MMSREELAEAVSARIFANTGEHVDLDSGWIGRLERGQCRWPGKERRRSLREVLGVTSDMDIGLQIIRSNPSDRPLPDDELVHASGAVGVSPDAPSAVLGNSPLRTRAGAQGAAKWGYLPNERFVMLRKQVFGSREALVDAVNEHLPAAYRMSINDIGKIEQGRVAFPRVVRREALRKVLDVDSDAALGLFDPRKPEEVPLSQESAVEPLTGTGVAVPVSLHGANPVELTVTLTVRALDPGDIHISVHATGSAAMATADHGMPASHGPAGQVYSLTAARRRRLGRVGRG